MLTMTGKSRELIDVIGRRKVSCVLRKLGGKERSPIYM